MKSRVMQLDGTIFDADIACISFRSDRRTGMYTYQGERGLCIELDDGWYQYRQGIIDDYEKGIVEKTFISSKRPGCVPLRGGATFYRPPSLSRSEKLELLLQKYHALFIQSQQLIRPDIRAEIEAEEKTLWKHYQKLSDLFSEG